MKNSLKIPKPNWLPQDKWDHAVIGIPFGMLAFVASHIALENLLLSLTIATVFGCIIGLVKEIGDVLNPDKKLFDILDVVASGVGAFLGGLFCLIGFVLFG